MNGYSKPSKSYPVTTIFIITLAINLLSKLSCSYCSASYRAPTIKRTTTIRMFGSVLRTNYSEIYDAAILELRGGASRKTTKKKNRSRTGSLTKKTVTGKKKVDGKKKKPLKSKTAVNAASDYYNNIPALTRAYVSMIGLCTFLGFLLGEERAQAVLALDPTRFLYGMEIWRPLTAASFLGKPSTKWLMSAYYLNQYGSNLEDAYGPAEYFLFLFTQISMLTIFSILLGIPFFTNSVITGMLWVLSRAMPHQNAQLLVIKIPYWVLPYGLMVSDCLTDQSASAAIPHFLGILVGHFYHFHRFVWPKIGGEDWLRAPEFLVNVMDKEEGKENTAKESIDNALKNRKRGKGKKIRFSMKYE